ncbi:MAG: N-acetylneuraminate synthase family protein, partial [Dehalococcoidia bacterium]|nr:N-acetylneuraminate synthase family protein [Dehalococcoidia bacterium]
MSKLIIAEISSAHEGSLENAIKLIELFAKCGVDCVKFQTHIANEESLPDAPNPDYFKEESRIEYFNRTSFSINEWQSLKKKTDELKIDFLSSPFSLEAVDMLEEVGVFAYKIPSGEVTNLPLLEKIAEIEKPVFLSSGMSDWNELDQAVDIFKKKCALTVMQCSSVYPCGPEQVGLNVITEIKERYDCEVGFSDHTLGFSAAISAVALGSTVIEKHCTFSRHMYGSDAKHSMEP